MGLPVDCIICAEPFSEHRIATIGSCDHTGMCSICIYRMRSLGKDVNCPMCKTKNEHVICCEVDQGKVPPLFGTFTIWGETCSPGHYSYDHKSQMFFPTEYYKKVIEPLWVKHCPVCSTTKRDMKTLKMHLQTTHSLMMCWLCLEHKQCFPCEQTIYTQAEYERHLHHGDNDGSEGHPNCEFCKKRYYDKYMLFFHLQKDHYTCHVCEKSLGVKYRYYEDYSSLSEHFRKKHYICEHPSCLEQKFVVFVDEISLLAHMRDVHNQYSVRICVQSVATCVECVARRVGYKCPFTHETMDGTREARRVLVVSAVSGLMRGWVDAV